MEIDETKANEPWQDAPSHIESRRASRRASQLAFPPTAAQVPDVATTATSPATSTTMSRRSMASRVAWTPQTQPSNPTPSDHFNEHKRGGILSALMSWAHALFRSRRKSTVQTQQTPLSDTRFLAPGSEATTSRGDSRATRAADDALPMQTFVVGAAFQYGNGAYDARRSETDSEVNGRFRPDSEFAVGGYRAYDSGIHSVNSAGSEVPITIEETIVKRHVPEATSSSEDDDDDEMNPGVKGEKKVGKACARILHVAWTRTHRPHGRFIYNWLLVVTLAFLYNMWLIPLRASFTTEIQDLYQGLWFALDALCDVIFILDIFVKFRTQLLRDGMFITDRGRLNRFHRREWTVLFDFLSILPLDLFFIKTVNAYFRMNRIFKFYRTYTFYRMVELKTNLPNLWRVFNLFHMLVLILHHNACIYYAASVGNGYGTTLESWSYPDPSLFPDYSYFQRKYTASFYWSLKELSVTGGRPIPESDWQFAYSIFLNLLGISLLSFFIGSVSMILVGMTTHKRSYEHAMDSARSFMKKKGFPKEVRHRVEQYYHQSWFQSDYGYFDEVSLFRHLPKPTRKELALHVCLDAVTKVPEFSVLDTLLQRELAQHLERETYLPGQFVFHAGDFNSTMYSVRRGLLKMIREKDGEVMSLREGDVFGEFSSDRSKPGRRVHCDVVSCGYSEVYALRPSSSVSKHLTSFLRNLRTRVPATNPSTTMTSYGGTTPSRKKTLRGSKRRRAKSHSAGDARVLFGESSLTTGILSDHGTDATRWTIDEVDSAVPSSPSLLSGGFSNAPSDLGLVVRPDIAEKVQRAYQQNLVALNHSLNAIWHREVAVLQECLKNTEAERDDRARQVMRYRIQATAGNSQPATAVQPTKPAIPTAAAAASVNQQSQQQTSADSKRSGKRTLLPKAAEKPDALQAGQGNMSEKT